MIKKLQAEKCLILCMNSNSTCPACSGSKLHKNGLRRGKQSYKCVHCGHQFVNRPNWIEMTQIMKEQILRCLLERSSLRSICRIFDISLGRLVRFIQKHMEKVPNDLKLNITEEMKSEDADYEVDELCSFVQKKKSKVWIWVVLHRETRQIVAFHMGGRGIKDCKKLWKKLEDLGIKGKLHTDLWKVYASPFSLRSILSS